MTELLGRFGPLKVCAAKDDTGKEWITIDVDQDDDVGFVLDPGQAQDLAASLVEWLGRRIAAPYEARRSGVNALRESIKAGYGPGGPIFAALVLQMENDLERQETTLSYHHGGLLDLERTIHGIEELSDLSRDAEALKDRDLRYQREVEEASKTAQDFDRLAKTVGHEMVTLAERLTALEADTIRASDTQVDGANGRLYLTKVR